MYQEYDTKTGTIKATVLISAETAQGAMRDCGAHLCEGDGDGLTHYVDVRASPPVVREKQPQQTRQDKTEIRADGEDFVTLSDLPIPCEVRIGEDLYQVDDGIMEWGTLRRGEYKIAVEAVPFLVWESEVRAV